MNDNAKVFSLIEMREMMIDTSDYQMMEEVGEFTGTLEMKAQGHKKSIRIFLTLDDGRKIITPIFWWQTYLGFYYMPIGTKLRLFYSESNQNNKHFDEYHYSRVKMRDYRPKKIRYRGSFKLLKCFGGLYAKYLHYMFLMGKLPKWNQRKPLSAEMREAWRYLDRFSRQVTLVSNKKLHTIDDVKIFISDTDKEIKEVIELREKVYNKLRRCDDDDRIKELKKSRDDCTTLLRQLRREKKIALTIIEDEPKINENIRCEIQAQNLARGRRQNTRKKEYER